MRRSVLLGVPNSRRGSCENFIAYRIEIGSHAIVLEADYLKTKSAQLNGARDVRVAATMLAAVNFDDQPGLQADKVSDKASNRVLPPESKAADLALAKTPPEYSLGADRLSAHGARSRS